MKKKRKASRKKSTIALSIIGALIVIASVFTFMPITYGSVGQHEYTSIIGAIKLGIDLKGGVYNVMEVVADDADNENLEANVDGSVKIIQDRLTSKGYTEATVVKQYSNGSYFIRVEVPDVDDPDALFDLIGKPTVLTFTDANNAKIKGLSGRNIVEAYASYDADRKPCVQLKLDDEGTKAFATYTTNNVDGVMNIVVDGETISSPKISVAITNGKPQITGSYTWESAQDFALRLQSGSLAVTFKSSEPGIISATLGENAIKAGLYAGVIGIVLVLVFMAVYYKGLGLAADLSLLVYILIVLFLMSQLPWVQLTLPGIAGVILGIGMAVDGNVIVFERIRDEFKYGKTLEASTTAGFQRASAAIWDTNITTIIAAIVLWIFGTGSIQGFAVTLTLSIVVSVFCSLVMTRWFVKLFYGINKRNNKFYGLKKDPSLDQEELADAE